MRRSVTLPLETTWVSYRGCNLEPPRWYVRADHDRLLEKARRRFHAVLGSARLSGPEDSSVSPTSVRANLDALETWSSFSLNVLAGPQLSGPRRAHCEVGRGVLSRRLDSWLRPPFAPARLALTLSIARSNAGRLVEDLGWWQAEQQAYRVSSRLQY